MNNVSTQTYAPDTLCSDCDIRVWDVWGCINNDEHNKLCLMCCGCPEHEDYWGTKCCGEDYYNKECDCCMNVCEVCYESED